MTTSPLPSTIPSSSSSSSPVSWLSLRHGGNTLLRGVLVCMVVYIGANFQGLITTESLTSYSPVKDKPASNHVLKGSPERDLGTTSFLLPSATDVVEKTNLLRSNSKVDGAEEKVVVKEQPNMASKQVTASITEESQEQQQQAEESPSIPRVTKTYPSECRWEYQESQGGYPAVAMREEGLNDYICPSMFRDLSDYVYSWPYEHFGENVWVANADAVVQDLPPLPIIYAHMGEVKRGELGHFLFQRLQRPYILITGQSDWGVPSIANARQILNDPNLVTWYAQNNDEAHPKITPIPIGLNCFEHTPEMQQARSLLLEGAANSDNDKGDQSRSMLSVEKKALLLVNFGPSHESRQHVWNKLCEGEGKFATCLTKSITNNIKGNPHLIQFYQDFASYKYVACPRGNGLDTHRAWEALYLGVVPIIPHSTLDPLFEGLPAMLVDSFDSLTAEQLEAEYPRFQKMMVEQQEEKEGLHRVLRRGHWKEMIENRRQEALRELGLEEITPRKRCWGPV